MSDDESKTKPRWEQVQLRPFGDFTDQLKDLRELVAAERDRVAEKLREKQAHNEED